MIVLITQAQEKVTISGFVKEAGSQEPLLGVNVYLPDQQMGTITNTFGFYSLTIDKGDSIKVVYSYVGYQAIEALVPRSKDQELDIFLKASVELGEAVVSEKRELKPAEMPQMSRVDIPVAAVKNLPALLGEKDLLKVVQLMPGVQSGGEGQSGFYVRGGGPDQNLIILDDATVYNAFHLFGFFSLFNGDAIRSVELTKGGFPARYGGRLSSVLDINMKEGNKEEFHGEGGIGIISSRLTLEGPIKKGKGSFLFSGRRTYIDALMRPFMAAQGYTAGYFFYDFTGKLNYELGRKDRIFLSAYSGRDKFFYKESYLDEKISGDFYWGNLTSTLRWNHLFNKKLFANTSLIYSQYGLNIGASQSYSGDEFSLGFNSGIRDWSLKYDMDYLPNPNHAIKTGFQSTYHLFTPNAFVVKETSTNFKLEDIEQYKTFESGLYVQDDIKISKRWRALAGMRFSHFVAEDQQFFRPEPRFSTSYMLASDWSVKASYAQMNQFIHLLSNTGIGLPTDLWVPATKRIKPQSSQQVAIGVNHDLKKPKLNLSLEAYYKTSSNVISYKEGASFLAIDDQNGTQVSWEDNVVSGQAESYGAEFLVEKKVGKFTGWVGYTLSWTWMQFDALNNGKRFHPKYDRRHDVSVVGMYSLSDEITISGTWVYGTGNAVSLPLAEYNQKGLSTYGSNLYNSAYHYGEKNSFRMAAYHRFDIGIQFHKKKAKYERTWELSFYNLYNRKNPFFYYLAYESNRNVLKQVTLFPLIPSISYGFKF